MSAVLVYFIWLGICFLFFCWAQKKFGTYDSSIPYDPTQGDRVQDNLQKILYIFLIGVWGGLFVYLYLTN